MPLLSRFGLSSVARPQSDVFPQDLHPPQPARPKFLGTCANPACSTPWLQIWRSRSSPIFESGWSCSPECTEQLLEIALMRELEGRGNSLEPHRHRIPLGLLMLEQGWITAAQLRGALEGQRTHKAGRLGHWLIAREGVSEGLVTRALGLQWSCPVLPLESHDAEGLAPALPRLFADAFGALPLRVAAGQILYLGFEDRPDPVLALAVERMTGLHVESGLVEASRFRPARQRLLQARFPSVELVEASSEPALVRAMTRAVERTRPVASRLVRVHDCLWLRMWRIPQTGALPETAGVADMIATLAG